MRHVPHTRRGPEYIPDIAVAPVRLIIDDAGEFSRVTFFDPEPDVILTGRINALHEDYRPQPWTYIPLSNIRIVTRLLNLKSHVSTGEVNRTIFTLTPTGQMIGDQSD
jgi:hypothetical protein